MITWRKSSRSGGGGTGGQECVELAALPGGIGIRDSKHPDAGHITLDHEAFARLVKRIKHHDAGG
ncbi:DUF397 domain-containing protein [Actinomadura scrupuli]|uniref:DUF397 domain-containing protein n=1 Tax=Actinomadura scrupuli TaxID=559629 RepID=UPI003D99B3F7